MKNAISYLTFVLFTLGTTQASVAAKIIVDCDSGRWTGHSIILEDNKIDSSGDGVVFPKGRYTIPLDSSIGSYQWGSNLENNESTLLITANEQSGIQLTIAYKASGVPYLDTIFLPEGLVMSTQHKRYGTKDPGVGTFYGTCNIKSEK